MIICKLFKVKGKSGKWHKLFGYIVNGRIASETLEEIRRLQNE